MRNSLLIAIILLSFNSFSQEKKTYEFEDGTEIDVTKHYDDPLKLHEYSLGVCIGGQYINSTTTTGLTFTPFYRYSDKLFFDIDLFVQIQNNVESYYIPTELFEYSKSTFIFTSLFHYEFQTNIETKNTLLNVKYVSSGDIATKYMVKMPLTSRKSFLFDGGINYSQFTLNDLFERTDNDDFYMLGQGAISLVAGISRYKTQNYMLTIEDKDKSYFKETKLSFNLLFGVPTSANIIKFTELSNDIVDIEIDPTLNFESPEFNNLGIRLNYMVKKAVKKSPNLMFKWGVGAGIEPSYSVVASGISDISSRVIAFNFNLGLAFGNKI